MPPIPISSTTDQCAHAWSGKPSCMSSTMALNIEAKRPYCLPVMAIHLETLTSIFISTCRQEHPPDMRPNHLPRRHSEVWAGQRIFLAVHPCLTRWRLISTVGWLLNLTSLVNALMKSIAWHQQDKRYTVAVLAYTAIISEQAEQKFTCHIVGNDKTVLRDWHGDPLSLKKPSDGQCLAP